MEFFSRGKPCPVGLLVVVEQKMRDLLQRDCHLAACSVSHLSLRDAAVFRSKRGRGQRRFRTLGHWYERIDQFVHGRSLQRHSGLSPVAPALNQLDCDKRLPPRSAATTRRLSKQPTRAVFRTRIAATAVQCDTCAGGPWQS